LNAYKDKYINPFTDFGFNKLFEQAELANYSDQEYREYEQSLKIYRDLNNVIETAYDEGETKGFQKGIEKGIRLTAQKLKQEGLSNEMISKVTDLTITEVEQLI